MDQFLVTLQDQIQDVIKSLPTLSPCSLPSDDSCPICLLSFDSILEDQESKDETVSSSSFEKVEYNGITKLGCGHIFCKRDLVEWIQNYHGSCPTCRTIFLDIQFPSDSDNESSDGGEYIPGMEDEDDEDDFFDGVVADEFEFDVEEMDVDIDGELGNEEEDWLTDGSVLSEEDIVSRPDFSRDPEFDTTFTDEEDAEETK